MPDKLIPINIVLADRTFRLKVNPADEEVVRKTIKMLNEKILEFKTNFAGKDIQDYVSMVLLWFATEQQSRLTITSISTEEEEKLNRIERVLDKALATE